MLAPIWFGERMAKLRQSIAAKECACPMANANVSLPLNSGHIVALWIHYDRGGHKR